MHSSMFLWTEENAHIFLISDKPNIFTINQNLQMMEKCAVQLVLIFLKISSMPMWIAACIFISGSELLS
jgi:hypothetical protein